MSSYLDGLKGAVSGAVCFVADKVDQAASYTFGTSPGSISGPACNDPTPPPPIPPPFEGGQCPVGYNVTVQWQEYGGADCPTGRTGQKTVARFGPIRGARTARLGTAPNVCPDADVVGDTIILTYSDGAGNPVDFVVQGGSYQYGPAQIISATRIDGLPDDCGDPPPPPPPPIPPQPINFTYINNEGDNVNVSGDVNIGVPILIAPFTLVAPVTITAGGVEFNGSVNLSPNFEVTIAPSFGGSGGGGGGGGGTPNPVEPIPPDDDDPQDDEPDEPDACEDTPIKGLVVTLSFSESMRATELVQDGSIPAIGVPRVATLYFLAKMGNRDVYMAGIDLKSRQQYVPVPFNSLVTCWRIHLEPGVSVSSLRPVFDIPRS